MKKLISVLLVIVLAVALLTVVGLASREPSGEPGTGEPAPMVGGWAATESPEITEDVRALVDKALEGNLGVNYTPVAYLGRQVVAGTNHCVLCQATTVYPGAAPYYALVYIYEDLRGGVEILDIVTLDVGSLITYD